MGPMELFGFGELKLQIFEDFFEHHAVEVVEDGPGEFAFANFVHGGAVAQAPAVGEVAPVEVDAPGFFPDFAFGDDGTAPVDNSAEDVEDEGL